MRQIGIGKIKKQTLTIQWFRTRTTFSSNNYLINTMKFKKEKKLRPV